MNCIRQPLRGTTNQGTTSTISENPAEQGTTGSKKKALKTKCFQGFVAEAVGFEPTSPCGLPDFEPFGEEIQ